jgi:hypothetical protein
MNAAAIPASIGESVEYKNRLSRVFFEGSTVHPDIVSSAYQKVSEDSGGKRACGALSPMFFLGILTNFQKKGRRKRRSKLHRLPR